MFHYVAFSSSPSAQYIIDTVLPIKAGLTLPGSPVPPAWAIPKTRTAEMDMARKNRLAKTDRAAQNPSRAFSFAQVSAESGRKLNSVVFGS